MNNNNEESDDSKKVIIIGAGLSGCLLTIYLAKRGYNVELYERRVDFRKNDIYGGRSINLALSERGRNALRKVNLEDEVVKETIAMKGRIMHDLDSSLRFQPYGINNDAIRSVNRKMLNEKLLNKCETYDNVKVTFGTRCQNVDLDNLELTLARFGENKEIIENTIKADYIFGADGIYSSIREKMTHKKGYNYSQTYIDHGYKELTIPPTQEGEFAMDPNALHIWPRGSFMMIALPNPDKTFTVTLFMPWNKFNEINNTKQLREFFVSTFPDSINLIVDLEEEYFKNPTCHLCYINTAPWAYENNRVALVGDAAHAVVPFYGQGMNASLEDIVVLDNLIEKNNNNLEKAIKEYSDTRIIDGDAICKLSKDNYIEMRDSVNSSHFLLKTSIEKFIQKYLFPSIIPKYGMVAFTNIPYHQVIQRYKKQDKIFYFSYYSILSLFGLGALSLAIPVSRNFIFDFFSSKL